MQVETLPAQPSPAPPDAPDDLDIALARASLLEFIQLTYPDYQANWFHENVCAELDQFFADVLAKKNPRLMLFAPPRHGKSEIVSRRFPAYVLGRAPDLNLIATSYAADLASRMNRDVQRVIESDNYPRVFPQTTLSGSDNEIKAKGSYLRTSDLFEIVGRKGSYRSAGVQGGITGMGADILLIDDPIKDAAQALSPTYRQSIWEWYTTTAYPRLMPGGGVLVILTRWHDDDLAGRILKQSAETGEKWKVVKYPAIAEHDEPQRKRGEPLHAERYPLTQLESIRKTIGSSAWASLYQQDPVPAGGGMFPASWWRFWTRHTTPVSAPRPEGCNSLPPRRLPDQFEAITLSVDANFKEAATSDFVSITVWGRLKADSFLLAEFHERVGFGKTVAAIKLLVASFPTARRILIEDKANGSAIIETLKSEITGIIPIEPEGGKEARAAACQPECEAGNVYLPEGMPWTGEWIAEFSKFPKGANDDRVDSMTQYLIWEKNSGLRRVAALCTL